MPTKQLTIADHAAEYLAEAGGPRGQGGLVEYLLDRHRQRWQDSLRHLLQLGWTRAALCAALDALNGPTVHADRPARYQVVPDLQDAQHYRDVASKHGAGPEEWAKALATVSGDERHHEVAARCLLDLAEAFWSMDQVVDRAVREG